MRTLGWCMAGKVKVYGLLREVVKGTCHIDNINGSEGICPESEWRSLVWSADGNLRMAGVDIQSYDAALTFHVSASYKGLAASVSNTADRNLAAFGLVRLLKSLEGG